MPEQSKFENMDLFASLEAIMKQNTGFYQSDCSFSRKMQNIFASFAKTYFKNRKRTF